MLSWDELDNEQTTTAPNLGVSSSTSTTCVPKTPSIQIDYRSLTKPPVTLPFLTPLLAALSSIINPIHKTHPSKNPD